MRGFRRDRQGHLPRQGWNREAEDFWRPGSLSYIPSSEPLPPVPGRATLAQWILLRILRRFPAKRTIFLDYSDNAAFEYESECKQPFWRFFSEGPEFFAGRDVLDLGCGWGGRPARWLELGARSVCGIEVSDTQVSLAHAFARKRGVESQSTFLVGVGEDVPCTNESFDLVVMNDVLEHVVSPRRVIEECHRVLRPGGRLAIVFPPYYDIHGGSHLDGYATWLQGLNLIFTTRALRGATLRLFIEQGVDPRPYLRDVPSDKLWNMNGLTVSGFERIVARTPFDVEQLWFLGQLDRRNIDPVAGHRHPSSRWRSLARPVAYSLAEWAARAPLLREVFCSRVCALLRKPEASSP